MVTEQSVLDALKGIKDPEAQRDIVSVGLVRDLAIDKGEVSLTLAFTTQPPGARATMHSMATRAVGQVAGVSKVTIKMARVIKPATLMKSGYLETTTDVDEFIKTLRAAIEQALSDKDAHAALRQSLGIAVPLPMK